MILEGLRTAFPEHAITSEEAGADPGAPGMRWIVDPLDGTTNFSRHNPNFSVSIAAVEDGEPVVGVIYDPLRDYCFKAVRGEGASFNEEPLATSGREALEGVMLSADWPRQPELRAELWALVSELMPRVRTLRCLGSAALNMVYVATGWFDLYLARQVSAWDQAAAVLLVREAGGAVGTVSGAPWTPAVPDPLLAATPELLVAVRRVQAGRAS